MENNTFPLTTILPTIINNIQNITFSWYDYVLFTLMLVCSALIGIYFGCFGSKQSTANEYLMGGKTMKVFPIAVSLVASHVSGITLLALPADVYQYGASYWLGSFSMIILCAVTIYIYLPVFFELQITSTYEYLELRFDNKTRLFASFLYALSVFLYLPIVIYIPALAFSAATGVNVHLITPIVCGVCIFYTTIGGLKAVVWTDTLQFTVTVGAVTTVFILGMNSVGGFISMWNKAVEGGRLDIFDFDIDPTKRDSFWAILIGLTIHWMGHTSVNQSFIQKFLSVPTFSDSKRSVIYFGIGMNLIKTASVLIGFVMYAKYYNCDPFAIKAVTKRDQLLPYYVMDVAQNIPGLSGLFIAGIFSAALSTLSATLNCLAGTIYEDFVKKLISTDITQKTASNILKLIVIITGALCTASVFIIEHLGGLLPLAIAFHAVTNGPLLGLFSLGMLLPRANAKGAFWGSLVGLIFSSWLIFSAKYYESHGIIKHEAKHLSTEGCDVNVTFNWTTELPESLFSNDVNYTTVIPVTLHDLYNKTSEASNISNSTSKSQVNFIFKISFYYYSMIGTFVTMSVGMIISCLTNKNEKQVDRKLISPVSRFLLPKEEKRTNQNIEYASVQQALHLVISANEKESKDTS